MARRSFLGGQKSWFRLGLIAASFVLLIYIIIVEERYILIIPGVLGGLAIAKYLSETYFSKDSSEDSMDPN